MGDPGSLIALAHASGTLSLDGFARLAAAGTRCEFPTGEVLMRQGDEAKSLFVILSGKVSVVREHPDLSTPIMLAALGPGEIVGEMGLLDGEPRSATVTALEETVAMEVPDAVLSDMVKRHPDIYGTLVKVLSKRLRSTDELAAQAAAGASTGQESEHTT